MQNADFPAAARARAITREDVWQAADALLLAGQRPTIERIRLHLGRGSPNTVSPHLDAWFAGLGARLQDPQAFAAPASLPDPVNQAARYLWEAAQAEARAAAAAGFADREAALQAAEQALETERGALAQERAVLEARLQAADSALAELARARDEAGERAARAESQLRAREADNQALRDRLAQAQQEKDTQRTEAASQRAAWDKERETMAERASANERRMALELDAARVAAKEGQRLLEGERRAAQQKLAEAADAAARQAGEATRLGNLVAVLEERLRQQEGMLAEYRQLLESRGGAVPETQRAVRPGVARSRQLRAARAPRVKI